MASSTTTVAIIGSGISGLYCAYLLKKKGIDCVVVEANDWVGGRIKPLSGFVPWKTLDLGAEFIHGRNTIINTIVNENGFPNRLTFTWAQGDGEHPEELFGEEFAMYYLAKDKKLLPYNTDHKEVTHVNEVLFGLSDVDVAPSDKRTLEDYLKEKGVGRLGLAMADAGYSNSLCAYSAKMSLYETVKINQEWDKNEHGDYRMENSMGEVTNFLAKGVDVRLKWPVKSINYENPSRVTLTSKSGQVLHASKVVVSVPLNILKEGSIEFRPPLPPKKKEAIQSLKMDNAIKLVLVCSKRFWPSKLNGVICPDALIPEMWFDGPERTGKLTPQSKPSKKYNGNGPYLASGFATSRFADYLTSLPREEIIKIMKKQLNDMFGNNRGFEVFPEHKSEATQETNVPNPADVFAIDFLMQDWAQEPYVRGGYTHPAPTANEQVRQNLAAPIRDTVFFAGEATHPRAYMTMGGAIETGQFAAEAIEASLKAPKAKL